MKNISYKLKRIKFKEALFCLLIYFLFINRVLVFSFALFLTPKTVKQVVLTSNIILYGQLLFPIPEWVADAWIGRYKVIKAGILISLIANVVTICAIITMCNISSSLKPVQIIICIGLGVSALGYAAMSANIIPFILDQCIGASGEELSALIHWTLWTSILGSFILKVIGINAHLIAEEHYEKYMDHEEDYWREHDYSYGSVN